MRCTDNNYHYCLYPATLLEKTCYICAVVVVPSIEGYIKRCRSHLDGVKNNTCAIIRRKDQGTLVGPANMCKHLKLTWYPILMDREIRNNADT